MHNKFTPPPKPVAASLNPTTVQVHQSAHECKPNAQPALRAAFHAGSLRKEVEYMWQHIRVNANAIVTHAHHRLITREPGFETNLAIIGGVFGGVIEKVCKDLTEPDAICVYDHGQRWQLDDELVASRLNRRLARVESVTQYFAEVDSLSPQMDFPGLM
jgi:hypothetical protein